MSGFLSKEYIESEMRVWAEMIKGYVPQTAFRIDPAKGKIRVLDIGCGPLPLEALVFRDLFESNIDFTGIDNGFELMDLIKELYPELTFIHNDARKLNELIQGEVDIILNSNVQMKHPMGNWDKDTEYILRTMPKVHRQGGLVLHTFYSEIKANVAKGLLEPNYCIDYCEQNKYWNLPKSDLPRHKFVLVGTRKCQP